MPSLHDCLLKRSIADEREMAHVLKIYKEKLLIDDAEVPVPTGELSLKVLTTLSHVNGFGDVYGGWVVSQMDLAGSLHAAKIARGRVATVSIEKMAFVLPVLVGSSLEFFTRVEHIGRSSMRINVEVWSCALGESQLRKVTEACFTFVAISNTGKTRAI